MAARLEQTANQLKETSAKVERAAAAANTANKRLSHATAAGVAAQKAFSAATAAAQAKQTSQNTPSAPAVLRPKSAPLKSGVITKQNKPQEAQTGKRLLTGITWFAVPVMALLQLYLGCEFFLFLYRQPSMEYGSFAHMWILSQVLVKLGIGILWLTLLFTNGYAVTTCYLFFRKAGISLGAVAQICSLAMLLFSIQVLTYLTAYTTGGFFAECILIILAGLINFYWLGCLTNIVDETDERTTNISVYIASSLIWDLLVFFCFNEVFSPMDCIEALHCLY